jgi:hypothetical protein
MSDIYGTTNALAIQQGNARLQEVRDLNERIKQHNTDVATTIQGLREQAQTQETIQQVRDTGSALWAGAKMPDKIKAYNAWKAARNATNPTAQAARAGGEGLISGIKTSAKGAVTDIVSGVRDAAGRAVSQATGAASEAINGAKVTATGVVSGATRSLGDVVEEGGLGRSAGEAAESAAQDIGKDLGSKLASAGGIGKDLGGKLASAGGKVAEEVAGTLAGKAAGLAGGLMGAAQGGIDIFEDIKSIGSGHGIAGNNNWEKAGNLLQIGGSIADLVGMAFPPAALLGGVLDLASGATDAVGEKLDADKKSSDLTQEQNQDTEKPVTVSSVPVPVATTALTAVTQRVQ